MRLFPAPGGESPERESTLEFSGERAQGFLSCFPRRQRESPGRFFMGKRKLVLVFDNTMGIPHCDVDDGLAFLYLLGREEILSFYEKAMRGRAGGSFWRERGESSGSA